MVAIILSSLLEAELWLQLSNPFGFDSACVDLLVLAPD